MYVTLSCVACIHSLGLSYINLVCYTDPTEYTTEYTDNEVIYFIVLFYFIIQVVLEVQKIQQLYKNKHTKLHNGKV